MTTDMEDGVLQNMILNIGEIVKEIVFMAHNDVDFESLSLLLALLCSVLKGEKLPFERAPSSLCGTKGTAVE